MENIQPLCISRQLWWGHQIPAWYGPDRKVFVALSKDSVINSKKHLKYLVAESQTSGGLNQQAVRELKKYGFYKSLEKSLNGILKRLNKV